MPLATDTVNLTTLSLSTTTYTVGAWIYRFANSPQVQLKAETFSSATHNSTGWKFVTVVFNSTGSTKIQLVPVSDGTGDVYVDGVIVAIGNYTGAYFDGDTQGTTTERNIWNGTPNASTSSKEIRTPVNYPRFSDDGTGIGYVSATVSYGTELLFNSVKVTAPTSESQWDNIDSQLKYGITYTNVDTLLDNSSQTLSLAQFLVEKYGEPEYRFQSLEVSLDGLSGDDAATVLGIELGDIVEVKFTPNGVGAPIQRYGQVTKIDHSIGVDRHNIVFSFGSLQFTYLTLDDLGFGILDEFVLAF